MDQRLLMSVMYVPVVQPVTRLTVIRIVLVFVLVRH